MRLWKATLYYVTVPQPSKNAQNYYYGQDAALQTNKQQTKK